MIPSAAQAILLTRKSKFYMELVNLEREIWEMVSLNRSILIYEARNIGNPRDSGVIDVSGLTALQLDFYNVLRDAGYAVSASENKWKITWTDLDAGVAPLQGPKGDRGDDGEGYVPWRVVTESLTAVAFDRLLVDTTEGTVEIVLPFGPAVGTQLEFVDLKDNFENFNLVLDGNSSNIMSLADDYVLAEPAWVRLIYLGGSIGWGLTWLHPGEGGAGSGGSGGSGEAAYILQSADYTALPEDRIAADTTNGGWEFTLPEDPPLDTTIGIMDKYDSWSTYPLTIIPAEGQTVDGSFGGELDPITFDVPARIILVYTQNSWRTREYTDLYPF